MYCRENFNPRTPCGVRPLTVKEILDLPISIHAPHAGCDGKRRRGIEKSNISIHAPHAGCDRRLNQIHLIAPPFQSTHPMRGATTSGRIVLTAGRFQSTHPMRGATAHRSGGRRDRDFNPRTPCGVRRRQIFFSILTKVFQSTHPMRGATKIEEVFG